MARGARRLHSPSKFTPLEPCGYRVRSVIGQGGFGTVFLADHVPTRSFRAVKSIYKGDVRRLELENEIELQRRAGAASSANVAKIFDVVEDPSFVFICLEACMGGHLLYRLSKHERFTERHAACAVADVLGVLDALHGLGIAHRDVKPQNLMYVDSRPDAPLKLIDFGMAVDLQRTGGKVAQFAGTIRFMAPSVIREMPYGAEVDLWALGVTAFLLLSGEYPFNGATVDEVAHDVLHRPLAMSGRAWRTVSDDAKDFIQRLLRDDALDLFARARARAHAPRLRTAAQALAHPWVQGRGPRSAGLLDDEVRTALRAAHRRNLLDTAISNLVAARLRGEDLGVLLEQFDLLDVNGDGYVTLDEYLQGVASLEVTVPELRAQFEKFDLNSDRRLSRAEFAAACTDRNKLAGADLPATFDFLATAGAPADAPAAAPAGAPERSQPSASAEISMAERYVRHRSSGTEVERSERDASTRRITAESLAASLLRMGSSETSELIASAQAAVDEADLDGDGAISYEEYCAWVQRSRELEPRPMPESRADPRRIASSLKRGQAWAAGSEFTSAQSSASAAADAPAASAPASVRAALSKALHTVGARYGDTPLAAVAMVLLVAGVLGALVAVCASRVDGTAVHSWLLASQRQ